MIKFSLVDVKNITSDVTRSNFDEAALDSLADIILESGGIIRPLVLKAKDAETYTIVDGHFEYYAAVTAKEKNPRKGEMVNAFVISPKIEDLIINQVSAIKGVESPTDKSFEIMQLKSRLTNLELRFEKQLNNLKAELTEERQRIDSNFKELENRIPEQIEPLNLLNTEDKEQLCSRLQRSKIPGAEKLAKVIIDARNKKSNQKFDDYRDVMKSVKGLGQKSILTIIDEWSKS